MANVSGLRGCRFDPCLSQRGWLANTPDPVSRLLAGGSGQRGGCAVYGYLNPFRGVVQSGRTPDLGSGSRRFESCHSEWAHEYAKDNAVQTECIPSKEDHARFSSAGSCAKARTGECSRDLMVPRSLGGLKAREGSRPSASAQRAFVPHCWTPHAQPRTGQSRKGAHV